MKLEALFEDQHGNRYYTVEQKMDLWQGRSGKPLYGGMAQPTFHKITAKPGDEIHHLVGGTFLIQGEDVKSSIHLRDPSQETEAEHHAYRHNPGAFVANLFKKAVASGDLEETTKDRAAHVRYSH